MSVLYFILLLGVLIFIHELGHYLAARAVGVTVTKFSLGFGPKIIGFTRGGTEFLLSAVPLGGYCKFMGDDPENPPAFDDRKKGFLTTDIWRRTVIVLAGPVFNLVLPLVAFLPGALSETTLPPAIIGTASIGGAAWEGGLRPGDRLLAINGSAVRYWQDMVDVVSANPEKDLKVVVRREPVAGPDGRPGPSFFNLKVKPKKILDPTYRQLGFEKALGRIEASLDRPLPVIMVRPGSPAQAAGLKDFDAVSSVDGVKVWSFAELMQKLREKAGRQVTLEVSSIDDQAAEAGSVSARQILMTLPPQAAPEGSATTTDAAGKEPEDAGISDGSFVILEVENDSAAAAAGLAQNDVIVALNGREYNDPGFLISELSQDMDRDHLFTVRRGTTTSTLKLNLKNPEWQPGSALPKYLSAGFKVRRVTVQPEYIPNDNLIGWAFVQTFKRTADVFVGTVASVAALFTGRVSFKQMGGPIMIYDLAASAGKQGVMAFLSVLGWLSVSLGVLNLLPIPILDGGHLVLFAYEGIRRRPPTMKERTIWSWAGLIILVLIMAAVMKNDIMRKIG
ncbi:MAG TPA: site-2 protease family protein [Myxococcota bacterium]|nr:site-2 protease family protein [Myxococcota bacterium]